MFSHILDLPQEIRLEIWKYALEDGTIIARTTHRFYQNMLVTTIYHTVPPGVQFAAANSWNMSCPMENLCLVNKQVYNEVHQVARSSRRIQQASRLRTL